MSRLPWHIQPRSDAAGAGSPSVEFRLRVVEFNRRLCLRDRLRQQIEHLALYGLVSRDVDEHRARLVGVTAKVADRITEQECVGGVGEACPASLVT